MTLYPAFAAFTEAEVNSKLFQGACRVGKYGAASRAQIDYLASLFVRNEASRLVFQDFMVNTSGNLPGKKASKMIEKLLAI
jgi:hypothetical protein